MTTNLIGQKIEHYQIEEIIGEGGMGTVYRVTDVNLARTVAMKVMHAQFAIQPQFQQRFQQEAQAAARLDHPSIVRVYHFGREEGKLYIVMEVVSGLSLGAYIKQLTRRNQVVRLDETILLIAQVADALGYAHRRGVVHRDVKPDNIIVKMQDTQERPDEPPLRAVVTDFGLAKLLEGGIQTQSGEFMGTLAYVSPEQVMDLPLDGRSDIYSLGVVLYQLATGKLPFDIRTPSDAVMKHINKLPPLPHDLQPGFPLALETVILKALAKRPPERFQTGEEMAEALRQAADKLHSQEIAYPADSAVSMVTEIRDMNFQEDVSQEVESDTQVRGRDRLLIKHIDAPPEIYSLYKREFTIGRSDECDIILRGGKVSRIHARLAREGGMWRLEDLGSTNGTFLAGKKLKSGEVGAWPAGGKVQIGDFALTLETAVRKVQSSEPPLAQVVDLPQQPRPIITPPLEHISADIRPKYLDKDGICRILVINKGDVKTVVTVNVRSPLGKVDFDAPSKQVTVLPGQKGVVDFYVSPRKRPFLGSQQVYPFNFQVSTRHRDWDDLTGQIVARPLMAGWVFALLAFLILLCIVLVVFASGQLL